MNHILLLGAGFSRTWGSWLASEAFEFLLGCPTVIGNPQLRRLLWDSRLRGGFEDALDELQSERGRPEFLVGNNLRMRKQRA